jgi:hypothetical protein
MNVFFIGCFGPDRKCQEQPNFFIPFRSLPRSLGPNRKLPLWLVGPPGGVSKASWSNPRDPDLHAHKCLNHCAKTVL